MYTFGQVRQVLIVLFAKLIVTRYAYHITNMFVMKLTMYYGNVNLLADFA